jgi:hypothetical protein
MAGSGSASGSISQRHGSADPDPDPGPHKNVMDPQNCLSVFFFVTVHAVYELITCIQYYSVLGIRIRRIRMFLGLPDPDPLVRGADPDPDPYLFS